MMWTAPEMLLVASVVVPLLAAGAVVWLVWRDRERERQSLYSDWETLQRGLRALRRDEPSAREGGDSGSVVVDDRGRRHWPEAAG